MFCYTLLAVKSATGQLNVLLWCLIKSSSALSHSNFFFFLFLFLFSFFFFLFNWVKPFIFEFFYSNTQKHRHTDRQRNPIRIPIKSDILFVGRVDSQLHSHWKKIIKKTKQNKTAIRCGENKNKNNKKRISERIIK